VRNEDVLLRVKEQRNILHGISKRKTKLIGHILRRNRPIERVIRGWRNGMDGSESGNGEEDVGSY
jgi:hypothetical protein